MADQIVGAVLGKIAEYLVAPIGRQFKYLCCYNNNVNNLRKEVEELKLKKDGEQLLVDQARNKVEKINPLIEDWMTKVEEIKTQSESILEDGAKGCFNGWCSNPMSRYILGRKVAKKTLEVVELKDKGKFDWVSCPVAPSAAAVMASTSTFGSTGLQSRMSITKEVVEALKDVEIKVIGICGMGGVGKTTIVTEVSKRANEEKMFDEVAMIVVSQNQDIFTIQGKLGVVLGLSFVEGAEIHTRADMLRRRLHNGKKILVIFDDVWEGLDLGEVGIPLEGDCNGLKVLLTSRIERVCSETGAHTKFPVPVLSKEEAWDLFKEKAGNCVDTPDLSLIAKDVAAECCGLPIAIVTVASALKDRRKHAWNDALRLLRNSTATDIPGMPKKVYSSIELSYEYLESEQAKSLFLLCCVFPEDYEIPIEKLVRYGVGLWVFKGIDTLEAKRDRVSTLVDELLSCHLLMESISYSGDSFVKIHDVVRDVGISIASKNGKSYGVKHDIGLKEWLQNEIHVPYTAMYLVSNESLELPSGLDFSELELLHLEGSNNWLETSIDFLGGMPRLRVTGFINIDLHSLAPSLHLSSNLRTLYLESCKLHVDISFIGSLPNLEIVSFKDSELDELPIEIGHLSNLKLLDLRCESGPNVIPSGMFSSFKRLEELYLGNYFNRAHDEEHKQGNCVDVTELNLLSSLNTLQISFRDPEVVHKLKNFQFGNLIRFDFDMLPGNNFGYQLSNRVSLDQVDISVILESNINLIVRRAETLNLKGIGELKNLVKVIDKVGFVNLKRLKIENCHAMKNLCSMSGVKCLVQLEDLKIGNCDMVEAVVLRKVGEDMKDHEQKIEFPKLRELELMKLPQFKSFYPESEDNNSVSGSTKSTLFNQQVILPSMEYLEVISLNIHRNIFGSTTQIGILLLNNLQRFIVEGCDELVNVAEHDQILLLQNLQYLKVHSCDSIETIFDFEGVEVLMTGDHEHTQQVIMGQLESMHLSSLPVLSCVARMVPKGDQLFQSLRSLIVDNCNSLRYLLSPFMAKSLANLQYMKVESCGMMEEIIDSKQEGEEMVETIVFVKLSYLHLKDLNSLTMFSSGRHGFEFPSLESLEVVNCDSMRTFCLGPLSAPKLDLKDRCALVEAAVLRKVGEGMKDHAQKIEFPKLKLLQLKKLPQFKSFYPESEDNNSVSSSIKSTLFNQQNLQDLKVHGCDSIETIFDFEGVKVLMMGDHQHTQVVNMGRLRTMQLSSLPMLSCIARMVPKGIQLFQSLTLLIVNNCNSLRYLLSPFMAKSLANLQSMKVESCGMMEEIIDSKQEGEEMVDTIVFVKLRHLYLEDLSSLAMFSSGRHGFEFPSLEMLVVRNCNSMRTFCLGRLSTPKLDRVYADYTNCVWMDDVNSTIPHLKDRTKWILQEDSDDDERGPRRVIAEIMWEFGMRRFFARPNAWLW